MFALFMGLSNFGFSASEYLGAGLLQLLGGVEAPDFPNLWQYEAVLCCTKALPILLVPVLIPCIHFVGGLQP